MPTVEDIQCIDLVGWACSHACDGEFFAGKVRIDSYLRPESYLGELGVDENLMSEEFWHTLREARFGRRRTVAILNMY